MSSPIFFVSGPPGSGKTTLCRELLEQFEFGTHLPIDDLREWVKGGFVDSVPWTDDSEAQFRIAEQSATDIAKRYSEAGFAVAIDHCRNPKRLTELINEELSGRDVRRILLMPDLETNLSRNRARTNKDFDPAELEETILATNESYRIELPPGWIVIDNSTLTPRETVDRILQSTSTT